MREVRNESSRMLCLDPFLDDERRNPMRKRISGAVIGGLMLAAVSLSPAAAQEAHCMPLLPDGLGCWIKCNVNYIFTTFPGGNDCTNG